MQYNKRFVSYVVVRLHNLFLQPLSYCSVKQLDNRLVMYSQLNNKTLVLLLQIMYFDRVGDISASCLQDFRYKSLSAELLSLPSFPMISSVPPGKCWENKVQFGHGIFFHVLLTLFANHFSFDAIVSELPMTSLHNFKINENNLIINK